MGRQEQVDTGLTRLFKEAKGSPEYIAAGIQLELAEQLYKKMITKGLKQDGLAKLFGIHKSHMTKILQGNANLTLRTLSKIALGLGYELKVALVPPPYKYDKESSE